MVRRIAIFLLAATIPVALDGDKRQSDEGEANRFRVSSEMVLVNASVLDSRGRPIAGLTKDNFRLFENHAEKRIDWFSEDQTPVSMVIVFDTSGSMNGKLPHCAEAVAQLLRSSQAGDEFALVTFANQPQLAQTWSRDEAAIPAALLNSRAKGNTAMIDALRMAGRYGRTGANARKLLFVLSDGGDNNSRWTENEVLRQLQEMDVELYALDIQESGGASAYPGIFEGPSLLYRLCEGLSGRYLAVDRMGELGDAVERIGREIRSQYVLGYRPGALERDGRFHPVVVKVTPPAGMHRISVRWRRGWREPQGQGAAE
jgi:Ca-activated chloride channel family protein